MLVFRSRQHQIRDRDSSQKEFGGRFNRVASTKAAVDFECILIIAGKKYDLSSWANAHPGGAAVLKKFNGLDATKAFERIGHSSNAVLLMKKFLVCSKDGNDKQSTDMSTEATKSSVPVVASWRKKIFTREDPQNIHKSCGLFVLLHFAFRYFQMLFGDPSSGFGSRMGKGASVIGLLCLVPHAILSLSSLIFHSVPKERIVGQPMIWQEFRAHSIIFASRSIICAICAWLSVYFDHDPIVRKIAVITSSMSILLANYAADKATKKLCICNSESTTATMPYWDGCSLKTQRRFKSFYAYCQFLATLACLTMGNPCYPFAVLLPIQLAAFLMTMVRKGFLDTKAYHVLYTLSLMVPYVVATRCMFYARTYEAIFIFVGGYLLYRLRCIGVDKYTIWVPLVVLRILAGDSFVTYDVW